MASPNIGNLIVAASCRIDDDGAAATLIDPVNISAIVRNGNGDWTLFLAEEIDPVHRRISVIPNSFFGLPAVSAFNQLDDQFRITCLNFAPAGINPVYTVGQEVVGNTHTAAGRGYIAGVDATAGLETGPKQIISAGLPAPGQVLLTFAAGVPTLQFNGGVAVTECAYQLIVPEVGNVAPPGAFDVDVTVFRVAFNL